MFMYFENVSHRGLLSRFSTNDRLWNPGLVRWTRTGLRLWWSIQVFFCSGERRHIPVETGRQYTSKTLWTTYSWAVTIFWSSFSDCFPFYSSGAFSSISCSYKAGSGFLYPLERGFMFVPKPPVHIRFDEISCVNFARVQSGGGMSSRSFDFEVEHKNGSVITFSSIDKYVKRTFGLCSVRVR